MRQQAKKLSFRELIPSQEWNIVKGDRVKVLTGDDGVKGAVGEVVKVIRKKNAVLVGGVNLHKRALPKTQATTGRYVMAESPIHVSNVQLIDPSTNEPTRVRYGYTEDGKRVRVGSASSTIIAKPTDTQRPEKIRLFNNRLDTPAEEVLKQTYVKPDWQQLASADFSSLSQLEQIELQFARQHI